MADPTPTYAWEPLRLGLVRLGRRPRQGRGSREHPALPPAQGGGVDQDGNVVFAAIAAVAVVVTVSAREGKRAVQV